jgi:hypothetical protein
VSGAELLEQALHHCRANRSGALTSYVIGTAPFLAALLYFWSEMLLGGQPGAHLALASCGVAAAWVWMNFWHAVFCTLVWRDLSGEESPSWRWPTIARVLAIQSAIQGAAVLALPVAVLAVLPLPWLYSFLQNCHRYAFEEDLGPTLRRAAEQASYAPKQSWQFYACASFLAAILFVNVLVAFVLLSHLLNSALGIATVLVRSPMAILDSFYLAAAASITYALLDPVCKTAQMIRCFHGESRRTGADLLQTLRRATVAMIVVGVLPSLAAAADIARYDSTVEQVLQRPGYEWSQREAAVGAPRETSVQKVLDVIGNAIGAAARAIVDWLQWFFGKPQQQPNGPPPGSVATVGAVVATVLAIGLLAYIFIRYRRQRVSPPTVNATAVAIRVVDVASDDVTPDQLAEDEWLRLADDLLRRGEHRLALRALFLGALAQLHRDGLISLDRHKTNLEYEHELTRRARAYPAVRPAFAHLVRAVERCWYGRSPADESVIAEVRGTLPNLRAHA